MKTKLPPVELKSTPLLSLHTTMPSNAYLFTYFVGNGESGLHLAWSSDGLKWNTLNGGRSYLVPQVGESKLMRDPFVSRGPDGQFHMVWSTSWTGKTIGYASTPDFIQWSGQKALPVMAHEPMVKNCWAPEIVWDAARNRFLIFWASTIPGRFPETQTAIEDGYDHRMYCTTTKDFEKFTTAELFYDPGFNVIDATMIEVDGKWKMIVKDETREPVAHKDLRITQADHPSGPFPPPAPPFTRKWVEGPTILRVGEYHYVYYDCYVDNQYGAVRTRDWHTWENVTEHLVMPKGAHHGAAISVERKVIENLL